jgi:iron complex transport system ATP-binding protein
MSRLLSVEDVAVRFGETAVLDDVSLSLKSGELVGLVGPNGAGKTTLLRAINGVIDVESGSVRVSGDARETCSTREWSRRVATVPQDTSASFAFDVEAVVEMGRTPHRNRSQFGSTEIDRRRVEDALERTDTAQFRDRSIDELSGGERQRVFVARALAQDTPLLLLDEPTSSLDINHQVEVLELIDALVGDGRGALAAIHDLDLAARFCDRIALLYDGQIQAAGDPETVLDSGDLDTAFATTTAVGTNPVTGTPTVTARSGSGDGDRHVHVLGGGRIGARAIATLADAGHTVSAGVLRDGDVAAETARTLGATVVTTPPTGETQPSAITNALALAERADVAVMADVTVGPRQWTLDVSEAAPTAVLVEERALDERLQAGQRSRERYEALRERGRVTSVESIPDAVEAARQQIERAADD